MIKQNNKSIQQDYKPRTTDKKSLLIGGIIVVFIAVTPFIFYSYKSLPNDSKVWETYLFTIETTYFSVNAYGWFLVSKVVPIILLCFWFFTCKHWWHWIILVPLAMYTFQLWGVVNQNKGLDELEIIYILPLMMIIIPFVYLIRAKLFNSVRGDNLQAFEEELGKKQSFMDQIKDLFR